MEISSIVTLATSLSQSELTELELSDGTLAIRLVRAATNRPYATVFGVNSLGTSASTPVEEYVHSPAVGTFIAEHPTTGQVLVKVGNQVNPGELMGLISYGRFIRAVEAAEAGIVGNILARSGVKVSFGQKLFKIKLRSKV
ncbi:acetyl-CoA carboxylase biotin carboxyl carrier protein [Paraburkholderia fungorum]|jgi:biotin carboxyl carrier protein|uniref:acetyl-CoA carboxylase biotin carboxyl carrier protein n=2 Tax=Pseudomonadota TaxID=1224 RepID=UPI003877B692